MKRFLTYTFLFFAVLVLAGLGTGAYFYYIWSSNLPFIGSVKEYRPPVITEIFSDNGEIIGRFWEEKRTVIPLNQVPKQVIQAFVAAEDSRFFEHKGVDLKSMFRAFLKNLTAGKIEQGGSTITQQVTKSLLLKNMERTYKRKVREAILSIQLDKSFSKEYILFLYLNQIYLGQGAYGVEAAARTYFNKSAKDLNLAQSALLAGLPQAPARYSPVQHFERAKARQRYVLQRMLEEKWITPEAYKEALDTKLVIEPEGENTFEKAPYFTEYIRKYLLERYGKDALYREGLKVYTTVNLKMQVQAREVLNNGLADLDKREGFRGPLQNLSPDEIPAYETEAVKRQSPDLLKTGAVVKGLVTKVDDGKSLVEIQIGDQLSVLPLKNMRWARVPNKERPYYAARIKKPSQALKVGDIVLVRIEKEYDSSGDEKKKPGPGPEGVHRFAWEVSLEQTPEVQGAVVCMDPETGEVKAMVGGRDFRESQFNRAVQSKRQPGSAFKPIIYSAALDWGMNPSKIIIDAPFISDRTPEGGAWKPKNYKEEFFGPTLLRTGLAKSRNVITVKLLKEIGIGYAIKYARKMGIESDLAPDLSLALGSSGVSLMELTRAYAVFANGGMRVKPIFIRKIVDRSDKILEENQPETVRVIPEETAYVMTDLMKAVITEGTAWRVKELKRPAAGKTGTTNNLIDAWFMGYTPGYLTGVWVGYDNQKEMGKGETGSRAASPIWLDFMSLVLEDSPVTDFPVPKGIVFAKIDTKTGLLASSYSEKSVFQAFKAGEEPTKYSPKPTSPSSGNFSQLDMEK